MSIIVIANQKGGVAKTTTACTLATGLADLGYQTVLVDCDPQGNVAAFLGETPSPALYELVVEGSPPSRVAYPLTGLGYPTLNLIAGDSTTVDLETLLRSSPLMQPATALREAIRPLLADSQTIVILDTAPGLSSVQLAALYAADWLIIPTCPEFAAEVGISAMIETMDELKGDGAGLDLLGILPTLVDSRSREHRQTIADLQATFPGLILPNVRRLIALAEAPRSGQPIWQHKPNSEAALDYAAVLKEVINRVGIGL
jgi:chromosome partitioning protein